MSMSPYPQGKQQDIRDFRRFWSRPGTILFWDGQTSGKGESPHAPRLNQLPVIGPGGVRLCALFQLRSTPLFFLIPNPTFLRMRRATYSARGAVSDVIWTTVCSNSGQGKLLCHSVYTNPRQSIMPRQMLTLTLISRFPKR